MNPDYLSWFLIGLLLIAGGLFFISLFGARPRLTLCLFAVFILFQWIIVNQTGGKTAPVGLAVTYLDEMVILLLAAAVAGNALAARRRVPVNFLLFGLAGVIVAGVLGTLVAKTPVVIALSSALIYFKGFFLLFVFAAFSYSEAFLKKAVKLFGALTFLILLLAAVDFIDPSGFRRLIGNVVEIDYRVGLPSLQSIFIHPGLFGWYCAFVGLYAFAFWLTRRRWKYFVYTFFCLIGVAASMRLKPLGAVAAAGAAGLFFYSARAKVAVVTAALALALVFLIVFQTRIIGVVREQVEEYRNPLKPRTVFYRTATDLAERHFPLGVGFGRFGGEIAARYYSPVYREYGFDRMHGLWPDGRFLTDTFWPMVLGELGVFGFGFYLAACLYLVALLRKACRVVRAPYAQAFVLGTAMVFIEGLVESLAEPVFVKPPAAYFIFAAVGISWSLLRRQGCYNPEFPRAAGHFPPEATAERDR